MRGRRLRAVVALAAICGFALSAAYALADDVISSAPTCPSASTCSYSSPTFAITGGQVAQFHNATAGGGLYGGVSHNVTADDSFGGHTLFKSATIASGASSSVNGTQYLAPGDYRFHCTIHGPSMSATLHVEGGTPLARPKVGLAIATGKLAKVRKTGKLEAKLAGSGSKASGVALKATLGTVTLARKSGVSVAPGRSEEVGLKLSKKRLKALKGARKAKIKLAASVPFGATASAKRTLH